MDTTLDELERLAVLHRAGSLSDAEFEREKHRVLGSPYRPTSQRSAHPKATATPELSATWRRRFAFYEAHGSPFSGAASRSLKELGFWERTSIIFNPWAFVFGILYFVFLGIPKRGLGLAACGVILCLISYKLTGSFTSRFLAVLTEVIYACTANYFYYIKVAQGRDEWNPFQDMR